MLSANLADATNLGLARMAAASQGVTRDQFAWTKDAYIREDSYKRALTILIDAQHRLPIASVWGDGTTSSSDGQFFRGGKRIGVGDINAKYGVDPGFSLYTHVSNQHGPYNVTVLSASMHEAPYVLDGLMHHGTSLNIAELYTDTGSATDHVFALSAMLGFRFCPRLRDFPDRRLASVAALASYPTIASLLGKRIRVNVIREHWDEVLLLVASLKAGHVPPSIMLRQDRADVVHARLVRKPRAAAPLPGRAEQERAAPCADAGDLHVPSGPDGRPHPRRCNTARPG